MFQHMYISTNSCIISININYSSWKGITLKQFSILYKHGTSVIVMKKIALIETKNHIQLRENNSQKRPWRAARRVFGRKQGVKENRLSK